MPVVVFSCGRSGTNVALEILRGSSELNATVHPEDKHFFQNQITYPPNYLTKTDTIYADKKSINNTIALNPNLKIIWTIRDPRDMCMSKIIRGQPLTEGRGNWTADDGTPEKAEQDIRHMVDLYNFVKTNYPDNILTVKMEDMLSDTQNTIKKMCDFIGIKQNDEMSHFPKRMRNQHKIKRYGTKKDMSQIKLWENLDTAYQGFFKTNKEEIQSLFRSIRDVIELFHYEN